LNCTRDVAVDDHTVGILAHPADVSRLIDDLDAVADARQSVQNAEEGDRLL
jgi:hypothetical protein